MRQISSTQLCDITRQKSKATMKADQNMNAKSYSQLNSTKTNKNTDLTVNPDISIANISTKQSGKDIDLKIQEKDTKPKIEENKQMYKKLLPLRGIFRGENKHKTLNNPSNASQLVFSKQIKLQNDKESKEKRFDNKNPTFFNSTRNMATPIRNDEKANISNTDSSSSAFEKKKDSKLSLSSKNSNKKGGKKQVYKRFMSFLDNYQMAEFQEKKSFGSSSRHSERNNIFPINVYFTFLKKKFNTLDQAMIKLNKCMPVQLKNVSNITKHSLYLKFFNRIYEELQEIKDMPNSENTQEVSNLEAIDDHFLLRKALMRKINLEQLKIKEIEYLEQKYGQMVPDLRNFLKEETINQIHLRNQTVGLLQRTLIDKNMNMKLFLNIMYNIEVNVNRHLLQNGSFFKVFFRTKNQSKKFMTFTCSSKKKTNNFDFLNCKFHTIDSKYLEIISSILQKKSLYFGFDVFEAPIGYKKVASSFYKDMVELSKKCDSFFSEFSQDTSMWNALAFKVQDKNVNNIVDQIYKQKLGYDFMKDNKSQMVVNEVLVVCFNIYCTQPQKIESSKKTKIFEGITKNLLGNITKNSNIKESTNDKLEQMKLDAQDVQMPDKETVDFIEELNEVMQIHMYKLYALFSQVLLHKDLFLGN